jgi:hypothetical protein
MVSFSEGRREHHSAGRSMHVEWTRPGDRGARYRVTAIHCCHVLVVHSHSHSELQNLVDWGAPWSRHPELHVGDHHVLVARLGREVVDLHNAGNLRPDEAWTMINMPTIPSEEYIRKAKAGMEADRMTWGQVQCLFPVVANDRHIACLAIEAVVPRVHAHHLVPETHRDTHHRVSIVPHYHGVAPTRARKAWRVTRSPRHDRSKRVSRMCLPTMSR